MPRSKAVLCENKMILAVVNYIKICNRGAVINYQSKNGMRTIGTELLKEMILNGGATNNEGDPLSWKEAAREDTRNLASGIDQMPEGTDEDVLSELIGQQIHLLPGNPDFMAPNECTTFLQKKILAVAKKQVSG